MSRRVVGGGSRPPARPVVETAWRAGSDYDDGGRDVQQYRGQTVWFATQHGKAQLVQSAMTKIAGIGVRTRLADTDALGTFTGEIDRPGDALDTVVGKARLALSGSTDLALASEGSFFPHPLLPFVATGIEMLAFIDDQREIVVVQRTRPGLTNWSHRDLPAGAALVVDPQWLSQIGFVDHSVCVVGLDAAGAICGVPAKGLNDVPALDAATAELARVERVHTIRVMTDMRAHTNPTRQKAITELATSLATRLTRGCPACTQAGWARIGAEPGRRCGGCFTPTERAQSWIFGCAACDHILTRPAPGPPNADPGECPSCNP